MSTTSLSSAYQACLWLAERKLDVPDHKKQGVWDLSEASELSWDRRGVISALGAAHFSCSLYHMVNAGRSDLSNSVDGPLAFIAGELVEESPFVISKAEPVTFGDALRSYLGDEIDGIIHQSYVEEFAYSFNGAEQSATKPEAVTIVKNAETEISEIQAALNKFAKDKAAGVIKSKPETIKPENKPECTAQAQAHTMLLDLLAKGVVQATGYETIGADPLDLFGKKRELNTPISIHKYFWIENPLPHYQLSAVHHGPGQAAFFAKRCIEREVQFQPEFLKGKEYWLTSIELDQSFEDWFSARLRKEFPLPDKATLKPQGNKYLVQFGADPKRLVKANDGLKLLRQILATGHAKNRKSSDGTAAEDIFTAMGVDDNYVDFTNQGLTVVRYTSLNASKGWKRKQQQLIYYLIGKYYEHRFPEDNSDDTDDSEDAAEQLQKTVNSLQYMTNRLACVDAAKSYRDRYYDAEYDYTELVNILLSISDQSKFPSTQTLRTHFARDHSEEEKLHLNQQKKIQDNLKLIKRDCPHFCHHIGSVVSYQGQGVSMTKSGFIYTPGGQITWDLGH